MAKENRYYMEKGTLLGEMLVECDTLKVENDKVNFYWKGKLVAHLNMPGPLNTEKGDTLVLENQRIFIPFRFTVDT